MATAIKKLMENPALYQALKERTKIAAADLCWEKEKIKLQAIYEPYLS